jgi:hypothetical protein
MGNPPLYDGALKAMFKVPSPVVRLVMVGVLGATPAVAMIGELEDPEPRALTARNTTV